MSSINLRRLLLSFASQSQIMFDRASARYPTDPTRPTIRASVRIYIDCGLSPSAKARLWTAGTQSFRVGRAATLPSTLPPAGEFKFTYLGQSNIDAFDKTFNYRSPYGCRRFSMMMMFTRAITLPEQHRRKSQSITKRACDKLSSVNKIQWNRQIFAAGRRLITRLKRIKVRFLLLLKYWPRFSVLAVSSKALNEFGAFRRNFPSSLMAFLIFFLFLCSSSCLLYIEWITND